MLELIILSAFLLAVIACLILGIDVLFGLLFGLILFSAYSLYRGHSVRETLGMLWAGVRRVKNVLILLVLIGCMTAVWRSGGTVPYILYHAIGLIRPRVFVLCTFLLCAFLAALLGSAFGTASTVGFILMMLSNAAGFSPALTGGAILAGAYVGDRGSPMSASAQLVSALTETDIYHNVKGMAKTAAVPFVLSCVLYTALAGTGTGAVDTTVKNVFAESYTLHWSCALPAALMVVLALCRVNVRIAMGASIVCGIAVSVLVQGMPLGRVLYCLAAGYQSEGSALLASLMDGGGIRSLLRVIVIPMISSSYSGIFDKTGLLDGVKEAAGRVAARITKFGATLFVSVFAAAASCNQTLGTILTEQICHKLEPDREKFAMVLENTVIVIAPLVPWGIAGSAPLLAVGAPVLPSMALAFYLYLIPLWNLGVALYEERRRRRGGPEKTANTLPKPAPGGYNSSI